MQLLQAVLKALTRSPLLILKLGVALLQTFDLRIKQVRDESH